MIRRIMTAIDRGRSVALIGPSGIGKTALLSAVHHSPRLHRVPLYSADASTWKSALVGLAEALRSAKPSGMERPVDSLTGLRAFLQRHVIGRPYVLLLDHVGRLTLRAAEWFESWHRSGLPLVVALSSLDPAVTGKWWWTVIDFDCITVPPLTRAQTATLLSRLLPPVEYRLPERTRFLTGITRLSHGNPGQIVALARLAQNEKYHQHGRTNFRLLALDVALHHLGRQIAALQ